MYEKEEKIVEMSVKNNLSCVQRKHSKKGIYNQMKIN